MKFLHFFIAAVMLSAIFTACSKDKTIIPQTLPVETPVPPTVRPVEGKWVGVRLGIDRSIPIYLCFVLKSAERMTVLNKDGQVIGNGTWSFNNDVLQARYRFSATGETHSVRSDVYTKNGNMGGTWGHDDNDTNGGQWVMEKVN
ncbi:MAG TPA: hypothetical protein VFI06_12410 [Chitinophagaceae bacterium]|nr:hypothetical protein [Chitinophagaceae bacterium]